MMNFTTGHPAAISRDTCRIIADSAHPAFVVKRVGPAAKLRPMKPGHRTLTALRLILLLLFLGASAVLVRFTFWGPFKLLMSVNVPINSESIIAVSFVLLLFLNLSLQKNRQVQTAGSTERYFPSGAVPVILIVAITTSSFWMTTRVPLLYDAYTDVAMAAHETFAEVLGTFYMHPNGGDFFFRPVGNLTYWFDFKWAEFNPFYWHLWNLAAHMLTSLLVYVFARQLSLQRFFAMISGLLFAIHGTRPEVASWVGERFDVLAAFFVLASLVACNRYIDGAQHRKLWYSLMLGCFVLALLSKESAYCLPLLVFGLIPFKPQSSRRKIIETALILSATSVVVFLYRYWVLRGIGGYRTGGGAATIFQFSLVRTIKGLLFREWAFFFFPVNWSSSLGLWTKLSVVIFLAVLCGVLLWSRYRRIYLLASVFMAVAASLPVQHLILLSQDLAGSRVLYLPMLGISIFWGFLLQGSRQPSGTMALSIGLIASQLIFLQHNLFIWREAAFLSQNTCRWLGEDLSRSEANAIVAGLPSTWHGIYFLRNGFSACVAMNSTVSADRVQVNEDVTQAPSNSRVFIWNRVSERLEEKLP